MSRKKSVIIITGPTGVGKTDLALDMAASVNGEIVNADLGQFYTPLTIGTAKPAWREEKVPHHLFDIIDEPRHFSVVEYRTILQKTLDEIFARGNTPIIVGGSGFYVQSFFFNIPPQEVKEERVPLFEQHTPEQLWQMLHRIDSTRAAAIHHNDRYRLERALTLWHTTGTKPSALSNHYDPLVENVLLINALRQRDELYSRIDQRVGLMLDQGWLAEVASLRGTAWEAFLQHKKVIGYDDILLFLQKTGTEGNRDALIAHIAQRTRNYAKRQMTFLRKLFKDIQKHHSASHVPFDARGRVICQEVNLTSPELRLYIKKLCDALLYETN